MTKNKKQKIQKKFSRQHLAMTLVLAVALTLGAWLAVVWPSAFAEADSEGHVHSVLCYDGVALNCAETDEAHEHTLNCLTGIELTCSEDHVHSLDCYAATSAELVCGVAEGQEAEHVHNMPGWECVPVKILTCTQPEHTHTAACQPETLKPTVDPKQDDGGYVIYETGVEESNDPLDPYDGPDVKDDEYGGFGGDDDFGFGGDDDNFGVDPGLDDDFGVDPEDPGTEGGDTDPADTEGGDTNPADTEGGDTNPADTEGGDTDPADTEGGDTNPADTEGGDTDPADTEGGDTNPADTEGGDTNPADTEGGETNPADTESGDTNPADTEGGDTNPADTEGGETNPADTEGGETDPVDTEGTTNLAAKKIYGLPVPLTELPENLPAADTATDYACGQTEHVHGAECYTVVWLCRQTVVINVPELPTSGTLNLLDGVTVEPAEIDGKPLQVMVAAVDAEDAKGNYHEPLWDVEANTLTVEADVTYEVTYVAYYLSDEPTEDSAMFALAAAEDGEQAGFPVMAGLLKVQARGNGGPVARIGTTEYDTLQKAIKAAEDAGTETTIVLLKDTKENITITKGDITLTSAEGGSFTISGNRPDNFISPTPDTAVNYKNNSVITITGGTFTLNGNITITGGTGSVIATNPQPGGQWYETYTAGGGVLVAGGTFNLQKGTISGNEANKGGGIYVMYGHENNGYWLDGKISAGNPELKMTGGTVTENSTRGVAPEFTDKAAGNPNGNFRAGEGGGIWIGSKTGNEITGGSITDNKCNTTMDWGGGGVYVNSGATLTIKNAVITDNTAYGLGGGISGCPHAKIILSIDDGAVLYDNEAKKETSPKKYPNEPYKWNKKYLNNVYVCSNATGDYLAYDKDTGFTADKAMDFYCVDECVVVGQSVSDDNGVAYIGRRIDITSNVPENFGQTSATEHKNVQISAGDVVIRQGEPIAVKIGSLGLTAVGRPTSFKNSVEISGNSSTTHGGGVASNGTLILGERTIEKESGNSWPVEIQKQLVAPDGKTSWPMNAGQFEFKLLAENQTTEIATGTNDANGKVRFIVDNKDYIGTENGAIYTFYVQEVTGSDNNIIYNSELHEVKVKVTLKTTSIDLDGNVTKYIKNSFAELLTEPENLTISNTLKSGDLSITKILQTEWWQDIPDDLTFNFEISIPKLPNGDYTAVRTDKAGAETNDNVNFADGKATVGLHSGETILIKGLPAGLTYTVTEQDTEDYTLVNSENEKGTITANATDATGAVTDNTAKVTFTNKRDLVNLAVTKNVELGTGSAEAPNEEFIINVQIGSNEETIQNGIFADDNVKTTRYIGDGVYTITLKADETATIHGIPKGKDYVISEQTVPKDFTLKNEAESLKGDLTQDTTVTVTNHYFKTTTIDIPFEKTWARIPEGGNALYPSSITVQLNAVWMENRVVNFAPVGDPVIITKGADGKWSHTFTDLPEYKAENVPYNNYYVKEIDIDYNTESAADLVAYLDKQAQTYGKHFHDVENVDGANNTFKILGTSETTEGQRELLGVFTVDNANANVDPSDAAPSASMVNTWIPASDTGENSFKVVKQTAGENPTKLPGAIFRLTDANGLVREAETDENGEAVFRLLPEGNYTLTEYKAPLGYQINPTEWTVDVKKELTSVSDESGAWLNTWTWTTDITGGEAGVLTVTDELITGRISITKALAMDTPELAAAFANQNFVFNIYAGETPDAEAEPVATLTVQPGQTAITEELPFGVYTIREVNPPQELGNSAYKGVTFVQGETTANGSIVVNIAEQQAEPVAVTATNNYTGFPSYAPQVNKVITGVNVPATVFNFTLAAADGNNAAGYTMPEQLTATVNGAGTASFGNILFKQAGTYNFTITEQNDGYTGFTYDESVWTLTVTVAEESGNLAVTNANYTKEGVATANAAQFTNTYTEQRPASVNITVRKAWAGVPEGQALPANAQMQLMRNGEAFGPVVAVNAAGGWAYTWDNLATADAEGNPYTYTVAEVNVPEGYQSVVTSDGNIFTVTNTYQEPATGSLTISKVLAGNALTDEIRGREFTVQLLLFAADGQTPLAGAYPYSGATNGTVGHEGTIVLRGGQSVTVTGLPENTIYRVVETDANGASMTETFYSDLGLPHVINDGDADTVEVRNVFNTTTPDNPGGGDEGDNTPELPNPNDPGTPDEITIYDDDVPLTYMKVQDPNNEEEFVYLPEDEVPLAEMPVPKTGDTSRTGWLALFTLLSLTGLAVLIAKKPKQEA